MRSPQLRSYAKQSYEHKHTHKLEIKEIIIELMTKLFSMKEGKSCVAQGTRIEKT